jgi:hypothetical protein
VAGKGIITAWGVVKVERHVARHRKPKSALIQRSKFIGVNHGKAREIKEKHCSKHG